jgi:cytochrome c peroxidase
MPSQKKVGLAALLLMATLPFIDQNTVNAEQQALTSEEFALAVSLTSQSFYHLSDPTNRVADNPAAAQFGEQLFNSAELSRSGKMACASCHIEALGFQDNQKLGPPEHPTQRKTLPLAGAGHALWYFWDGRKDSLWSQTLAPLEDQNEHQLTRTEIVNIVGAKFGLEYERLFEPLPRVGSLVASPLGTAPQRKAWAHMPAALQNATNQAFANVGKSIAAYIRTLPPETNRFDAIVQGTATFNGDELAGFRLFTGKAACSDCHAGAMLTDSRFHNTGVPQSGAQIDGGRAAVLAELENDPFRCGGQFSDAGKEQCGHLVYASRDLKALEGAFKTPSLRGVSHRRYFMHSSSFNDLADVIDHYNRAPKAVVGENEMQPLGLTGQEKQSLLAFLRLL